LWRKLGVGEKEKVLGKKGRGHNDQKGEGGKRNMEQ